jgi:tetratricopeptide (TPR) repeat protein
LAELGQVQQQQEETQPVDQQTKAALKQDKFVTTTTHGIEWASDHRKSVLTTVGIALAAVLLVVLGAVIYSKRADAASVAFGAAMQTYQTPVAQPGQAVPPGMKTFASDAERAKAANQQFLDVANKYSLAPDARIARYFAGLSYIDMGQNQSAEDTLKKVAGGWNSDLAGLAKVALAGLYHQTGRDAQAIDIYNQLTAKPTTTVPAGLAQLQLAELYESEGKTDLAKAVYAKLKDQDKDKPVKSPAAVIAAEKLNPAPRRGGPAE